MKEQFEVFNVHPKGLGLTGVIRTKVGAYTDMTYAHRMMKYKTEQVTFEDVEDGTMPYSHMIHYREGEHYNDQYWI